MIHYVLAGVAVLAATAVGIKAWADGQGPFDSKPSRTNNLPESVNSVKATSGNPYTVTCYRRPARNFLDAAGNPSLAGDQLYYVAVRSDASKDWVSYVFSPVSKQKMIYRANAATPAGIDILKKDFGLQ